jgi:uncharacterized protein with HEPN domain
MLSNFRLSALTKSLAFGFFADKAVLAVARYQRLGTLGENDKKVLERVAQYFKEVLEGYHWLSNPKVSKESIRAAAAFSEAVNAFAVIRIQSPKKRFEDYIKDLLKTAEQILSPKSVDKEKTKELRKFFFVSGRSALIETDCLLEGDDPRLF